MSWLSFWLLRLLAELNLLVRSLLIPTLASLWRSIGDCYLPTTIKLGVCCAFVLSSFIPLSLLLSALREEPRILLLTLTPFVFSRLCLTSLVALISFFDLSWRSSRFKILLKSETCSTMMILKPACSTSSGLCIHASIWCTGLPSISNSLSFFDFILTLWSNQTCILKYSKHRSWNSSAVSSALLDSSNTCCTSTSTLISFSLPFSEPIAWTNVIFERQLDDFYWASENFCSFLALFLESS